MTLDPDVIGGCVLCAVAIVMLAVGLWLDHREHQRPSWTSNHPVRPEDFS